ncbi:hypothetical protein C8F01DRAFT_1092604 [Mycena amicta]|nr:hypothetical protein C8F01DRAFT_1092604 [Mycena amicta]
MPNSWQRWRAARPSGPRTSALTATCPTRRTAKDPTGDFWERLDEHIKSIRKAAAGDAENIVYAFHHILKGDQQKYDCADTYEIDKNAASAFQDDMDTLIVANSTLVASATGPPAGGDNDPFT